MARHSIIEASSMIQMAAETVFKGSRNSSRVKAYSCQFGIEFQFKFNLKEQRRDSSLP